MNSKSKYEKSLEKRNARPSGPIAPVTPRGLIIQEILELMVEEAGQDFDQILVTLNSHMQMGLPDEIRGVKRHQFMVDVHERDEFGKPLAGEIGLKNGHCIAFAAIGESEENLKLTLEEIRRAKRWGATIEDLKNGITCGEVLLRNGIDPGVAMKSLDTKPELN